MPKDEWGKSKNKQVAKRINRELAQEREIQEALWDARSFSEGSANLTSELLHESEWTVCKFCMRNIRFRDYDEHLLRCKDDNARVEKKVPVPHSSSRLIVSNGSSNESKAAAGRFTIGSRLRVGKSVGNVVKIKGNRVTIESGKEITSFRVDLVEFTVLQFAAAPPNPLPKKTALNRPAAKKSRIFRHLRNSNRRRK